MLNRLALTALGFLAGYALARREVIIIEPMDTMDWMDAMSDLIASGDIIIGRDETMIVATLHGEEEF